MGLDHAKDQDELIESVVKKQMDSDAIKHEISTENKEKEQEIEKIKSTRTVLL